MAQPRWWLSRWGGALLLVALGVAAVSRWWPVWVLDGSMALGRWQAGLSSHSVKVGADEWAYLDSGGAGEPLVLVHGFAANKESWLKVATAFKGSRWRLIVPDLPGFGASPPAADGAYAIDAQAARLHAFVQQLGLAPIHLVGHSMGGYLAGTYAAAHPGEVRSLYLVAPAGVSGGPSPELKRLGELKGGNPLIVGSVEELHRTLALAMAHPPAIPDRVAQLLVEREAPYRALREHQSAFWTATPLEQTMHNQPLRLRVAWGELDRVLPVASAAVLAAAVPGASVLRLPDVGHIPPEEAPQALAADLKTFLLSAPPAVAQP